jgi:hypothetical protein
MERMPNASDFPIGSAESRAAARMMLESRRKNDKRMRMVFIDYSDKEALPNDKVDEYEDVVYVWTYRRWVMMNRKEQPLKPNDFPIGSVESRAAVRMLHHKRRDSVQRTTYWIDIGRPNRYPLGHAPAKPYTSGWSKMKDSSPWRSAYLPPGMSEEEAERVLGE